MSCGNATEAPGAPHCARPPFRSSKADVSALENVIRVPGGVVTDPPTLTLPNPFKPWPGLVTRWLPSKAIFLIAETVDRLQMMFLVLHRKPDRIRSRFSRLAMTFPEKVTVTTDWPLQLRTDARHPEERVAGRSSAAGRTAECHRHRFRSRWGRIIHVARSNTALLLACLARLRIARRARPAGSSRPTRRKLPWLRPDWRGCGRH